jgi:hypothetical protein
MDPLATSHFSNRELLADYYARVGQGHKSFAILLTRMAEIDERRLYLEEGYSSMTAFLLESMRLPTHHSAWKRLTTARTAQKYPGILVALFDGRLHMTAVLMLAPHLTPSNADELVAAALDKTCFELQVVLAERFPRPDLPERISAIAAPELPPMPAAASDRLAAKRVDATFPDPQVHTEAAPAPSLAAQRVEELRPRVVPLAPQRFGYQYTVSQETHELCEYAKALLSHEIPRGEMALVLHKLLELAVPQLEKRKFAATHRPGHSNGSVDPRHILANDKREVWVRDGGQCTFVAETGKRCGSDKRLEFHHNDEFACGGPSIAKNLRLLCRAHNQHEAERSFGAEFMERKRSEARQRRAARMPVAPPATTARPYSVPSSTSRQFS